MRRQPLRWPAHQLEIDMKVLAVVRAVAVVCIGLLAGIYLADRAGAAARSALEASSFVAFQQSVHVTYVRMMPPLVISAILAVAGWLFSVRSQWRGAEFWLVATSACAIVIATAMTRAVNVPLNTLLMTWSVAAPPANLKELWAPWERVDAIRTALAIGAFVLQVLALGFKALGAPPSSLLTAAPDQGTTSTGRP